MENAPLCTWRSSAATKPPWRSCWPSACDGRAAGQLPRPACGHQLTLPLLVPPFPSKADATAPDAAGQCAVELAMEREAAAILKLLTDRKAAAKRLLEVKALMEREVQGTWAKGRRFTPLGRVLRGNRAPGRGADWRRQAPLCAAHPRAVGAHHHRRLRGPVPAHRRGAGDRPRPPQPSCAPLTADAPLSSVCSAGSSSARCTRWGTSLMNTSASSSATSPPWSLTRGRPRRGPSAPRALAGWRLTRRVCAECAQHRAGG